MTATNSTQLGGALEHSANVAYCNQQTGEHCMVVQEPKPQPAPLPAPDGWGLMAVGCLAIAVSLRLSRKKAQAIPSGRR